MRRLIFFVLRARVIKVSELVERQLAIAFGRAEQASFLAAVGRQVTQLFHARVSGSSRIAVAQAASAGELLDAGVEHPAPETVFEPLVKISHLPEFFFDPAA